MTVASAVRADGLLPFSLSQTQTQTLKVRVATVATNGDATLDITLESLALRVKPDASVPTNPEIAIASTDPSAKEEFDPATPLRLLVGSTLSLVVSPTGEVREVKGLATLRETINKAFADAPALKPLAASFTDALTDEAVRRNLESVLRLDDTTQPAPPLVLRGVGTLTLTVARATTTDADADADALAVHRTTDFALASPNTDPVTQAFTVSLGTSREESEYTLAPAKGLLVSGTSTLTLTTILTPRTKDARPTPTTRVIEQSIQLTLLNDEPNNSSTPQTRNP
jgi:hypothetical protein